MGQQEKIPGEDQLGQMEIDFDSPGMEVVGLYWNDRRRSGERVVLTSIGGGEYRDRGGWIYVRATINRPGNGPEPRFERTERRVDDRPDEDFFA